MYMLQLKFELARLLRSGRTWILLLCLILFFGFSFYSTEQRLDRKTESVNQMLEAQHEKFAKQKLVADSIRLGLKEVGGWWQDPNNPIMAGGDWKGGRVVIAPPQPNNRLSVGARDIQPDAWELRILNKFPRGDAEFENPANLSFGTFDLAFVVAFLLPLLVIALSFDLISAERELGTLPLLRSQPVVGARLFFAKALTRFTLLALINLLVLVPFLIWSGIAPWSGVGLATILLVLGSLLLWFLIALGINLQGGNSAANALKCIGAWVVVCLLLPSVVNTLTEKLSPVPSRSAYINTERAMEIQLEQGREDKLTSFYRTHPNYRQADEEEAGYRYRYGVEFALNTQEEAFRDSVNSIFEQRVAAQARLSKRLLWLSPTLSIYAQLSALAGTDKDAGKARETAADALQNAGRSDSSHFFGKTKPYLPPTSRQSKPFRTR